ncbi:MAG: DUF4105 domain-containing protein [Taibaiella sp.]|nr:DUF4105 domain-containing protein [Taibaiella sp.]
MYKKLITAICLLFITHLSFAQGDSSHLRVSLLTCGAGEEIWETFGHTGVRVIDSNHHTDIVYNYGTFDGYDKDFDIKFMKGKLLYYISYETFAGFMREYIEAKRPVQEQILQITGKEKQQIDSFLKWNAQPDNKYYKYDFYFDNCATRIRDIFPTTLGPSFHYGNILPTGRSLSFRDISDQYLYKRHWERFGIDILLGSRVDKIMSNADIMFLPDFLRNGVASATVNGKKIAADPQTILPGTDEQAGGVNQAFIVMLLVFLLTLAGLMVPSLRVLGKIMTFLLLFITGLLGWLILFMWFGTDHQACQNNYNVLWALPTNLILAYLNKRNKNKYAVLGIILILISLLLHVLHIQKLPLLELMPLLLSLLMVYGTIYRKNYKNDIAS